MIIQITLLLKLFGTSPISDNNLIFKRCLNLIQKYLIQKQIYCFLPLKNPTALSGCVQRKQPHWNEPPSNWSADPPTVPGHNWKTSKYPECLSSFSNVSWSLPQGKALVTTWRNVLFSHLSISQQCFRLVTLASLELKACWDLAWKKGLVQ